MSVIRSGIRLLPQTRQDELQVWCAEWDKAHFRIARRDPTDGTTIGGTLDHRGDLVEVTQALPDREDEAIFDRESGGNPRLANWLTDKTVAAIESATGLKPESRLLTWVGDVVNVTLEITFTRDRLLEFDHIEVRSIDPENYPLPITETGYRSNFAPSGTYPDIEAATAAVLRALDEKSNEHSWRERVRRESQQELFDLDDIGTSAPQTRR